MGADKYRYWALLLLFMAWPLLASNDDIRIELYLRPPHLDPTLTPAATVAETTYNNIYQGLTRINRHGDVEPLLADRWDVSEDGLRYVFHLQPDVYFHNGQPFDAEVAAFSLRRLLDPEAANPQRFLFSSIAEVSPLSRDRLEVRLHRPDSLLLFRLGLSAAVMVEPKSSATNKSQPVGTGPYEFVSWQPGKPVELRAFPDYWRAQPPIRQVSITFTSNRVEMESSLADVDFYPNPSPMSSVLHLAKREDYLRHDVITEGETLLVLNHDHPALADRRVRRALSHAVDRKGLLAIYPSSPPALIGSHFSPRHPAYIDLSDRYPHDPERARELLAEAGYEQGLELTFKVPPPLYAQQASLHIADDLEAVGIRLYVERVGWTQWLSEVFSNKDYDLTLIAHVEPFDLDIYAREAYYFNYHSTTFNQLWSAIERETEEARRHELLQDAQRYLAEEAVHVFLHMRPQQSIRKAGLKGFWKNAPVPAVIIEELYWEETE